MAAMFPSAHPLPTILTTQTVTSAFRSSTSLLFLKDPEMEVFIDKVKKYPCLWDTNSVLYRDIGRKEIAWESVSRECGLSNAKEAKSQWKRLRDSHREALRRRKTSTGQAAINNKPWKYEKLMEFLQPQTNVETSSNYKTTDETKDTEATSPEDGAANDDAVQGNVSITDKKPTNKSLAVILDQREKKREQRQNERDELRRQVVDGNRYFHEQDAMMSLFISMCEKTKALPKYLQLRVQREVFESVTRAEEEHLSYDIY